VISVKGAVPGIPDDADAHVLMLMGALLDSGKRVAVPAGPGALRTSHVRVLEAVGPDKVRVSELAERTGMTAQGVGQFVAALVDSGHLALTSDPEDGRAKLVLTLRAPGLRSARLDPAVEAAWADRVGPERYAIFRSVVEELARGPR
jgi:DNA-binding MarR family transcriptional regulator